MAKSLNFKTIKKQYLSVTLSDGKILQVGTPTKKAYDALKSIQNNLQEDDNGDLDEIYASTAIIMSKNKTGKVITKEYLEKIFDIEDILIFFNAYVDFIEELSNQKN